MELRITLPRWFWWLSGTWLGTLSWSLRGFNGEYLVGQYRQEGNTLVADYSERVTISTMDTVTITNAKFHRIKRD